MLEIFAVSKSFPDAAGAVKPALDPVTLSVGEHEIVSLVGTSGCGKSTLLRILSGLDHPTAGRVTLSGKLHDRPTEDIAMVFQEPRLMPWLTVAQNIRLVLHDLPKGEQDVRIADVLEKVHLTEARDAYPKQLSGGMAQRVGIARALARRPSILLLDEPFGALDSFTRQKLQDHLLSLWADDRFTMIFVTHDVEEAIILSDRVVILKGQPGAVDRIVEVDLPQPRLRSDPAIAPLKQEIVAALDLS